MKINKAKSKKSLLVALSVALLVVLVPILIYASSQLPPVSNLPKSDDSSADEPATVSDEELSEEANNAPTTNPDKALEPETPQTGNFSVIISSLNVSEETVRIRILIQSIISGGVCDLTLRSGGSVITKSVSTQASANTSTCQGFDIPVSELGAGQWTVDVNVRQNTSTGNATGEFEI